MKLHEFFTNNKIAQPGVPQVICLIESRSGKNTHLTHLEDIMLDHGHHGAQQALYYLHSVYRMLTGQSDGTVKITTKWDGSPALIAGRDPASGKFFVGTKSVFNKEPKMNFTVTDIQRNHPAEGLQQKLIVALQELSKLKWTTVAQGDMLWSNPAEFKVQQIKGQRYVTFTPNTITYAVPANNKLAAQMTSAKIGIVWHTEYTGGNTLAETTARFGFDHSVLGNSETVWHRDATIANLTDIVTLTKSEAAEIMHSIITAQQMLSRIDAHTFEWLNSGSEVMGSEFLQQLKAHTNNQVRQGRFEPPAEFAQSFVQKYVDFMNKKIAKYKTHAKRSEAKETLQQAVSFIKTHLSQIMAVYQLYLAVIQAKVALLRKLAQIKQIDTFVQTQNGLEATGGEGFVAVNRHGSAVKLVDRLEFSRLNFGTGKPTS